MSSGEYNTGIGFAAESLHYLGTTGTTISTGSGYADNYLQYRQQGYTNVPSTWSTQELDRLHTTWTDFAAINKRMPNKKLLLL